MQFNPWRECTGDPEETLSVKVGAIIIWDDTSRWRAHLFQLLPQCNCGMIPCCSIAFCRRAQLSKGIRQWPWNWSFSEALRNHC
jgi:hypothetical protein